MSAIAAPQQVNLLNPALLPKRERFSARQLLTWVVLAVISMAAVAWWAMSQTQSLRSEMAQQAARTQASAVPGAVTPQQVAMLEQVVRDRTAQLEARKAARDALKRGMAGAGRGPSAVMRQIADSIPAAAWLVELRAAGTRIELVGRTLDPSAVDAWIERLRAAGLVAPAPSPSVRLERIESPPGSRVPEAYTFQVSAALAAPLADEGGRP